MQQANTSEIGELLQNEGFHSKYSINICRTLSNQTGDAHIENCEVADEDSIQASSVKWKFRCPLKWDDLVAGPKDSERFCDKCQKTGFDDFYILANYAVYYCQSATELRQNV